MDKDKVLDDIFNTDPFGLLKIKPKQSASRTPDERLLASFMEINEYVAKHGKEPEPNAGNVSESSLYFRLKGLREDSEKAEMLKTADTHNLLPHREAESMKEPRESYKKKVPKEITSVDDIFGDDSLGIFDDDEGDLDLFKFKHTPKEYERASADFVARRKPCKDFDKYKPLFTAVQNDLAKGKRKLVEFKLDNLREGAYYVHAGVLFLLEKIEISKPDHYKPDGTRVREDGRTRCIFENGTESNLLKRSVEKILYINGKVVTENADEVNTEIIEKFSAITKEDEEAGYIYVLKSKSADENISSIANLFKIGFSKADVQGRIKNAQKEPTYLMAEVEYIAGWKCFNMNTQKFEQLIHNFFGSSCLELDVFDEKGKRHTPREWFIAPFEVIEQAIELIISGEVVDYRYDASNEMIIKK